MNHSPLPWRIDQDNEYGIVIVADNGDTVHEIYYNNFIQPSNENIRTTIIQMERANAYFILAACNKS